MTASIHAIYVYPIKSMGGISMESGVIQPWGIDGDREYMLVDDRGVFLTQRTVPEMALIQVELSDSGLQVDASRLGESMLLKISENEFTMHGRVEIWNQQTDARYTESEIDTFFSDVLHRSCRLVRMPRDHRRSIHHQQQFIETSFADSLPLMIANRSSLLELNSRLVASGSVEVLMDRFRPNLVLDGMAPFSEDNMSSFQINGTILHMLKPCSRCALVNVHQQTAEVSAEPLKTLATFRRVQNKVNFGVHTRPDYGPTMLSVGDLVNCVNAES